MKQTQQLTSEQREWIATMRRNGMTLGFIHKAFYTNFNRVISKSTVDYWMNPHVRMIHSDNHFKRRKKTEYILDLAVRDWPDANPFPEDNSSL